MCPWRKSPPFLSSDATQEHLAKPAEHQTWDLPPAKQELFYCFIYFYWGEPALGGPFGGEY